MLKIQRKISAYNHYTWNKPQYIVIHDVGAKSTAKNNVDYFAGGNRGASAHLFVDDTECWQSVEFNHGAWHVGDGDGKYGIHNQNSIGIEMCLPSGTVTVKTEQNTIEIVQDLMKKYNISITNVVRHYDASRKNCPAQFNLDKKWTRWVNFKSDVLGKVAAAPSKPVVSKPVATAPKYKEENFTTEQVTDVVLNVRKEPNTTSPVVETLKPGTRIKPTKIVRNGEKVVGYTTWCNVPGGGWVSMAYTTPYNAPVVATLKGSNLPNSGWYTCPENMNIRSGAGTNFGIVGSYGKGQGFNYSKKVVANGYVWLYYKSYSGHDRYVAVTK